MLIKHTEQSGAMMEESLNAKAFKGKRTFKIDPGMLTKKGTLAFALKWDAPRTAGMVPIQASETQPLIEGILSAGISLIDGNINIVFNLPGIGGSAPLKKLKAHQWYHVAMSWDIDAGEACCYLNGVPQGTAPHIKDPTPLPQENITIEIGRDDATIGPITLLQEWASREQISSMTAGLDLPPLEDEGAQRFGQHFDVEVVRGDLVEDFTFEDAGVLDRFFPEGPATLEVRDGKLWYDATPGHSILVLRADCPKSYLFEWDLELQSNEGLMIIFFNALGKNGEDILGDGLQPREAEFPLWCHGDLNCYHISYWCPTARGSVNMRKNPGFKLTAIAEHIPSPETWKGTKLSMALAVKESGEITLSCNGKALIIYNDNDSGEYGAPHPAGKIALRSMQTAGLVCFEHMRISHLIEG